MAQTLIVLDRQAVAKTFSFGTTSASGEGLVTINKGTAATSTVVLDVKASANIAGDLNLTGNLNITGSVNTQSVTNTNVQDITITLNDGGTTAGAAGAGILVEGDSAATIAKILYDSSLASKWKIGDGSSQAEVVTVSGTQTLTNKTIAGSQISGNITGNAANVTGTVAVGNGGTGATTLTGVLIGNGTSAFTTKTNPSGAFIGDTDTQTLTNKTLTSPKIGTSILDTNGNTLYALTATASAVNYITFANAASGGNPSYTATGTSTNISINFVPKGTGTLQQNGVDVVTTSGTQTLTNKTIAGSQISGNITGNAANVTGTVAVANGGTGLTTTTPYALIAAGTTATGNFQQVSGLGSSGQVLTSNGAGALPTWQNATGSAASSRWTTVSGTQDSSNKVFTIGNALNSGSEIVVVNGQVLDSGSSNDYVLSGTTLTFQAAFTAPASTDKIKVYGVY